MMKSALGFLLATAAMAFPAVGEAQIVQPQSIIAGTRLDVTAHGAVKRVPDIAVINTGVVTQAVDAATAMRDNAARMSRVVAALKKAGLADKDISTTSISLNPQYRYVENQVPVIVGYQASNQLNVRFRDIGKSGAILDILVKEGSNQINGPSMTIDDPGAAQDEARVAAMKAARARADLYANAAGLKVKRIVSISESEGYSGGPVPMMAMSMARDAAPKTEIMPGEQSINVTVSVVFELN
jgi:uncharacterized protein